MTIVVRAFPLRGSVRDLNAFAAELHGARASEAAQFYLHYGVAGETWHLQETANGPWVIAVTKLENASEAAARYADATEAFHVWFKTQVMALTGIDPNVTPLGPPTTEVFSWSAPVSTQPKSGNRVP